MTVFQSIIAINGGNLWEKLLIWYEGSVIKDLINWLDGVFGMEFTSYQNFTVSARASNTVRNVIIGLMLGMMIASAMALYTRSVQGKFVRELLRRECFTPERALTLHEVDMFSSLSVRRELSNRGALSRLTRCAAEERYDGLAGKKPFVLDFKTAHFYIPEELKYRADVRYTRRGFRWPQLVAVIAVSVLAAYLLCRYLPALVGLADWLISVLS